VPGEGERGHRHLPVLAVLPPPGELGLVEVLQVGGVDLADQLADLGILEIRQVAELAEADARTHRGTVAAPVTAGGLTLTPADPG
jgi:hypothetical protein